MTDIPLTKLAVKTILDRVSAHPWSLQVHFREGKVCISAEPYHPMKEKVETLARMALDRWEP